MLSSEQDERQRGRADKAYMWMSAEVALTLIAV